MTVKSWEPKWKKVTSSPNQTPPSPPFNCFLLMWGGGGVNEILVLFSSICVHFFFMLPPHRKMASTHLTFSSVGDVREAARKERKNPFFLIFHSYVLRKEIQTTGEKCDSSIHYLYTSHTRGLLDYISMRPWRQRSHPSWHEHLNDWPYNWSKIQMENWG